MCIYFFAFLVAGAAVFLLPAAAAPALEDEDEEDDADDFLPLEVLDVLDADAMGLGSSVSSSPFTLSPSPSFSGVGGR